MKITEFINKIIFILLVIFSSSFSYVLANFDSLRIKETSYLDFFLLKLENKIINRAKILGVQMHPTRIQYSNIGIEVNFDEKNERIQIDIVGIMDKSRYSKKKYKQKLSDCNIVRNLIFYRKQGYTFFRKKKDFVLTEENMKIIFREVFLNNLTLNEKEINFILNNIFVRVNVVHPVNKTELICAGKITDFELR